MTKRIAAGGYSAKLKHARKLRREGRIREALAELTPLLAKRLAPIALIETRLLVADCYIDLAQPKQAIDSLTPLSGKTVGDLECARASKMGLALLRQGQAAAACMELTKALELFNGRPPPSGLMINFAAALLATGQIDTAISKLETWLTTPQANSATPPLKAEALNLLGNGLRIKGELDPAINMFEQAKALCQRAPASLYGNLALAYWEIGDTANALDAVQTARQTVDAQGLPSGRFAWLEAVSHIVAIPDSTQTVQDSKTNWDRALKSLEAEIEQTVPNLSHGTSYAAPNPAHAQLVSGVCTAMPFFLGYLGGIDRSLHDRHGRAVNRVMSSVFPKQASRASASEPINKATSGAARIGIVTTYLRPHSVWKIPLHGWLAALSNLQGEAPSRSDIAGCVHVLTTPDPQIVNRVRAYGWNIEIHTNGPLEAASAIQQRNYNLLLYPEIGMDAQVWQVAALRLARHQAYGLGHPVTTGLPTLDSVLSSDLMESEDAPDHYTEELVRIPDLGCPYLEAPPQPSSKMRTDFGLASDRPVLLSCQTVFKYQPQDDSLYAEIAKAIPDAQIVFLTHASDRVTQRFKARLSDCFAARGLVMEAHCAFLPQCSAADFAALNACCDVFLDAPGWSGFNSSLEATRLGVPVVTLPGTTCRTRHALAVMKFFGLETGIADSQHDYVEKVKALLDTEQTSEHRSAAIQAAEQRLKRAAANGAAGQALRRWCLDKV